MKYPKNVRMIPMHLADLVSKVKEMPDSFDKEQAIKRLEEAAPHITAMMELYNQHMIEQQRNLDAARQAAITGRPVHVAVNESATITNEKATSQCDK